MRTISELYRYEEFEDRFKYLALRGNVGVSTFGFDRYLNQQLYRSREWKSTREFVISRDNGCDLGVDGYEIHSRLYIHHINPLTPDDIKHGTENLFDPEYLITTTHQTHNAIHYGDERQLPRQLAERRPGDTKLW